MYLYARADVELCPTNKVIHHGYERRADRLWSLFQRGCQHLDYSPDHYDGEPDGYRVTTTLFPCDASTSSRELTEVVGADASQFGTHHINNKIAWPDLQELGERLGRRDDTGALAQLLRHGFTLLFRPNS